MSLRPLRARVCIVWPERVMLCFRPHHCLVAWLVESEWNISMVYSTLGPKWRSSAESYGRVTDMCCSKVAYHVVVLCTGLNKTVHDR